MAENTTVSTETKENIGSTTIRRKIGNTIYNVTIHFNSNSKESMEDKILRLARHDAESMGEAVNK